MLYLAPQASQPGAVSVRTKLPHWTAFHQWDFWLNFSKVQQFFLWVGTGNLSIVEESSLSLVSKTTWTKKNLVRFSSHTGQVFKKWDENLTRVTWKPDEKNFVQVVLDTRDIEDSASIFRFPVSTQKKTAALLKKLRLKLDQFGGSLGLKPLWLTLS